MQTLTAKWPRNVGYMPVIGQAQANGWAVVKHQLAKRAIDCYLQNSCLTSRHILFDYFWDVDHAGFKWAFKIGDNTARFFKNELSYLVE